MDLTSALNSILYVYNLIASIKGFGDILKGVAYITIGAGKLGNWVLSIFGLSIPNQLMGLIMILASGIIFWNLSKSIFKFLIYYVAFIFALSLIVSAF